MKMLNASLVSLVESRKARVLLEAKAVILFRTLLKLERGRKTHTLLSPRMQEKTASRIKTIDSQIAQIRREIRKIRSMS
ncbi:hypothetical protein [Acidiferrobacter sp.]